MISLIFIMITIKMPYLVKLSHFSYFFLVLIVLAFTLVFFQSNDQKINKDIVLIFTLLLVPLFDGIYNMFSGSISNFRPKNMGGVLLELILPLVWGLMFLADYIIFLVFLLGLTVFAIYRSWDPRFFFACALVLFCYAAFYLLFGQNADSERFSVLAYYLLFAAAGVQIAELLKKPKTEIS